MKISFITTSSLATNPRLVKEVVIAQDLYKEVEVICFQLANWSDELDEKIKLLFNEHVKVYSLSAARRPYSQWLFATVAEKLAAGLYPLFKKNLSVVTFASNKRSFLLLRFIKKNNLLKGSSLVVGHNLGALYPVYYFSKELRIPFAFDVEDYHPGEKIETDSLNEKIRRELLMKALLPKAAYVTAASPLIGAEVSKICKINTTVINNSFFSSEFNLIHHTTNKKVKLVWFSQNISFNRGLELVIPALDTFGDAVTLTLIGNLDPSFSSKWLKDRKFIEILPPMEQQELHKELVKHDVGLALELHSADFNREIALTNKIFAYLQAGLFIIATDTNAQKNFIEKFASHGIITKQTINDLEATLSIVINKAASISDAREERFFAAKSVAYENEAEFLKQLWLLPNTK